MHTLSGVCVTTLVPDIEDTDGDANTANLFTKTTTSFHFCFCSQNIWIVDRVESFLASIFGEGSGSSTLLFLKLATSSLRELPMWGMADIFDLQRKGSKNHQGYSTYWLGLLINLLSPPVWHLPWNCRCCYSNFEELVRLIVKADIILR